MTATPTRSLSELIADGAALSGDAPAPDLVDALILMTHRLHDIVEDHGERSKQADDLRARRRRVRAELVGRVA